MPQAAFQRFPQLLAFATRSPSAAAAQQFEGWAEKLESHISDLPPPLPTGGELTRAMACPVAQL